MARPLCGLDEALVRELAGRSTRSINVAGVVDFNPPLDEALAANAHRRAEPRRADARALERRAPDGHLPHEHLLRRRARARGRSTRRIRARIPFPRCRRARRRRAGIPSARSPSASTSSSRRSTAADDAFRQSEFAEVARKNLALARRARARRRPTSAELGAREAPVRHRAHHRGRASTARRTGAGRTSTRTRSRSASRSSRGAASRFSIARPACCESCVEFPERSYSEGINTSSPLIYLIMKGQLQILAQHVPLDLIPTDYVVAGMILALAELLEGTAPARLPVRRERREPVHGPALRRDGRHLQAQVFQQRGGGGNPLRRPRWPARIEPNFVDRAQFERVGPPAIASAARGVASLMRTAVPALAPAAKALENAADGSDKIAEHPAPLRAVRARRSTARSTAPTRAPPTRARPRTTSEAAAGRPSRSTGSTG